MRGDYRESLHPRGRRGLWVDKLDTPSWLRPLNDAFLAQAEAPAARAGAPRERWLRRLDAQGRPVRQRRVPAPDPGPFRALPGGEIPGGVYWHIAPPTYETGTDLLAFNEQSPDERQGWKWDDAPEGFDGDVVSLFSNHPEHRRDLDWMWSDHPDFVLLRVDVPDPEDRVRGSTDVVSEGYPAVLGSIPADWITPVRSGYDESLFTEPAVVGR